MDSVVVFSATPGVVCSSCCCDCCFFGVDTLSGFFCRNSVVVSSLVFSRICRFVSKTLDIKSSDSSISISISLTSQFSTTFSSNALTIFSFSSSKSVIVFNRPRFKISSFKSTSVSLINFVMTPLFPPRMARIRAKFSLFSLILRQFSPTLGAM